MAICKKCYWAVEFPTIIEGIHHFFCVVAESFIPIGKENEEHGCEAFHEDIHADSTKGNNL